jgi:hypothetical protein
LSTAASSTSSSTPLTSLQAAALAFTDASTKDVKVPSLVFDILKTELMSIANVSRFLANVDVAGKMQDVIPWPIDMQEARSVTPS